MAPYIPPNRKRFVIPKKILERAARAGPLNPSPFNFEDLPSDVLVYLLAEHMTLPDLVCLCFASKRFLHLLASIDASIAPILHYQTAMPPQPSSKPIPNTTTLVSAKTGPIPLSRPPSKAVSTRPEHLPPPRHDPSPSILPVLTRLQSHSLLPRTHIPCQTCCKLRRIGTKSSWWDICEEKYSDITWRRRRNPRSWVERRVTDYEYTEFYAAFGWAWRHWERWAYSRQRGEGRDFWSIRETEEGGWEVEGRAEEKQEPTVKKEKNERKVAVEEVNGDPAEILTVVKAVEESRLGGQRGPMCPECWGIVEAKKINARPPLRC